MAFTGADNDKKGLLVQAQGGTLFLDEIGKMPLAMQGKLLHFLDTKSVRPVGSNRETKVDVRIVAASKTDLHARSRTGGFLEDLYYRLVDFPLTIPPLRERADDVELLTRHFSQRFCQELGTAPLALDRVFMDLLVHHSWPGNIRELEKTLKRAIVLAQGDGCAETATPAPGVHPVPFRARFFGKWSSGPAEGDPGGDRMPGDRAGPEGVRGEQVRRCPSAQGQLPQPAQEDQALRHCFLRPWPISGE